MDLHQLWYFVKVAEHQNFTRAAEECFVTQPSLSRQISRLEQNLGQQLFERRSRQVVLTDAGRLLYDRAKEILHLVEDTEARLRHYQEEGRGRVTIGAIPTVAPFFLPELLKKFVKRFPNAEVDVHEAETESLVRSCLDGSVDLGILALPLDKEELELEPLFEEELYLVTSPEHPLAEQEKVTLEDLETEPFILLSETHCLTEQIVQFCREKSVQHISTAHINQLAMVQELVSLGQGISLIPEMARRVDRSNTRRYRSLTDVRPTRTLAMAWQRGRFQSYLVREWIQMMRERSRSAKGE